VFQCWIGGAREEARDGVLDGFSRLDVEGEGIKSGEGEGVDELREEVVSTDGEFSQAIEGGGVQWQDGGEDTLEVKCERLEGRIIRDNVENTVEWKLGGGECT
jgi:hypothetical protein